MIWGKRLKIYFKKYFETPKIDFMCDLLNISTCEFTETQKNFTFGLYNPSDISYRSILRLPVNATGKISVKDENDKDVPFDVSPIFSLR